MKNKKGIIVLVGVAIIVIFVVVLLGQGKAILQAKRYRSKGMCLSVMTPAVHTLTRAKYTFPSSCLPSGWEQN